MRKEFYLDGQGSDVGFKAVFEGVQKGANGDFRLKFSTRPTDLARGKLLTEIAEELELKGEAVFVTIREIG